MNERVSIIIPAYNIEKEIERCVKSVLAQTYQEIQVIIVNDGSTDGTLDVLRRLEKTDNCITVIDKVNDGVTKARLTGVEYATGDWIGFVDGDDYIESDMYEHLLDNAHKYQADISHCGYQMVFPSRVDFYYNTGRLVKQDKITGLKDLLSGEFIEPGLCNKLFRKTLFHSLLHDGVMDLSIKNYEDLLMNYYLFREAKKSVYEDFCPYHYMVRKGSASTSKVNEHKLRDPLAVLKIIKRETVGFPQLQQVLNERIVSILINLSTMPTREQKELVIPYRNSARKELRNLAMGIFKGHYSCKLKLQVAIAIISPWTYMGIHTLYARIRGTDKKYEVR